MSTDNDSDIMTKNLGSELHYNISIKDILWKMKLMIQVLALGETPMYHLKEKCVQILDWSRQKGRVPKSIFYGVLFCLDHSKLEVELQKCWTSLMTDDCNNVWKSE